VITGVSHITLICANLDRAEALLVGVLGGRKTYDSGADSFSLSPERFFDLGGVWIATMQGASLPAQTYNHIAFKIDEAAVEGYRTALLTYGATLLPDRPRVDGEGRSVYFYDDDNHLFELHTGTLQTRLARYRQPIPQA
jgi:catechol 2,3-dioxygenase-like lactoylglutathione lyase family enzyme